MPFSFSYSSFSRAGFLLVVFAALLYLVVGLALPALAAELPRQPNILFIFADDLAFDAVGPMGNKEVQTPNLDQLAKRGLTFTHAYNMGSWSGAVCVASRTMLITGRQVWDANRIYDRTDHEREAGVLWPQLLATAGYDTYFTGKWHIKTAAEKVFGTTRHVRPGMPGTVGSSYNRPLAGEPDKWSPFDKSLGGFWEGGKHWSEVVADDAEVFLATTTQREKPFFMYLAFNAPHDPRQAPEEFVKKYPADKIPVPANFIPENPHMETMGAGKGLRDEKLAPFPRTEHAVQVHRGEYYAAITHLDVQVGRILAALEKTGKQDNTWIVFTADHGLAVGQHGLMGKQNQFDHSVRVPFIVAGPNVTAGTRIDSPIYLQDVMPTTLELAGTSQPDHVWFRSLLPRIRGATSESPYKAIFGAYLQNQRAITSQGFKLIQYPKGNVELMFDLRNDPLEMHDLSHDPAHAATKQRLQNELAEMEKSLNDPLLTKTSAGK